MGYPALIVIQKETCIQFRNRKELSWKKIEIISDKKRIAFLFLLSSIPMTKKRWYHLSEKKKNENTYFAPMSVSKTHNNFRKSFSHWHQKVWISSVNLKRNCKCPLLLNLPCSFAVKKSSFIYWPEFYLFHKIGGGGASVSLFWATSLIGQHLWKNNFP